MLNSIPIINRTLELSEVQDKWFFDEAHQVWCLEDVLYTLAATTPKFQRLSIFVPAPYMSAPGVIDPDGTLNGYTAATAPVVLNNNSAGYMQMPHMWLGGPRCYAEQYLERGFVYVTCGNRGHESRDESGKLCGKAPINLVDLKTVVRFLRHNKANLPGDLEKIISVGWSAGGAMSTLLSVTGNSHNYDAYLAEAGAFPEERDDVFAAQIYCPIIDLEHADLAYEWCFAADHENEDSPAGPGGVMTPFQEALSAELSKRYVAYFNRLGLRHPVTGEPFLLGEDGRSGAAYDYLMEQLSAAAGKYLRKLENGSLPVDYSAAEYLAGNYTYETPAPMGGPDKKDKSDLMQGHAGPGVALRRPPVEPDAPEGKPMEPPTLGDMVSRPPKGVPAPPPFQPAMMTAQGKDKSGWLRWDGEQARVSDLDSYVLNHRRRMKPCTSFDVLVGNSGENKVFGTAETPMQHFCADIAPALEALKERFPEEYAQYAPLYGKVTGDADLARREYLINPLNYIGTDEQADQAKHFRIRVGASDADTSFSVGMTLAVKLANAGKDVDYALVWERPHSEADYPGEVCDWIESICN